MYVRTSQPPAIGMGDATSALLGGGISAAVGLATSAASLWMNSIQLSHQADTATTQIVNGLAPKLQAIHDAYFAGPRTCADQAAALAAVLSAFNWLFSTAGCGNGAYGSAGNRCISDRFGPGGPTDPTGAKYPWPNYYYWPIYNDQPGCIAQIAADNPDAALESAIANVGDTLSGSRVQTTPGQYDTGSGGSAASASPLSAAGGINLNAPIGPLPLWGWLAAGLIAVVVLK